MRTAFFVVALFVAAVSVAGADSMGDCTGVIRVFGEASSWISSCFVIGDGSWVVVTSDAVTEKMGPQTEREAKFPLFISSYSGRAYQCELKAVDKDLKIALLKLPVSGLPSASLAKMDDFSKAAYGTAGELMSGDPVGNRWLTEVYGITRQSSGSGYKLGVGEWSANKVFVTDMGKYKWMFISDVSPEQPVPNGSIVARDPNVAGMYVNRLRITGGSQDVTFGRCVMSTEIAQFAKAHSVDESSLYAPPSPTMKREEGADAAFQLQSTIYSLIGGGKGAQALNAATEFAKLRPTDPQAQMMLGAVLVIAGKYDEALKAFDDAAKLDPKWPNLHMNRALALVGLKKTDDAEAEFLSGDRSRSEQCSTRRGDGGVLSRQ